MKLTDRQWRATIQDRISFWGSPLVDSTLYLWPSPCNIVQVWAKLCGRLWIVADCNNLEWQRRLIMPDMAGSGDTKQWSVPATSNIFLTETDRSQNMGGAMPFLHLFGILYHYVIISTTGSDSAANILSKSMPPMYEKLYFPNICRKSVNFKQKFSNKCLCNPPSI